MSDAEDVLPLFRQHFFSVLSGKKDYIMIVPAGKISTFVLSAAAMTDKAKSKTQLLRELEQLRTQVREFKKQERKLLQQSKNALQASEEKYRTAFEWTGTAMMVIDEDTMISMANHKAEEVTGYPAEEVNERRKFPEFIVEEDLDRMLEYHKKRRIDPDSVPHEYEFRLKHKNGSVRDILINVSMIPGSRKSLVSLIDITERKKIEREKLEKARAAAERAKKRAAGLKKEIIRLSSCGDMVSRHPQMKKIFDLLPEVAQTSATVLVTGESGTGKELVARSLHELGSHREGPFMAINCSALPDNLLESELFGYKAGAFTDAKKDKPGKLALADGGTVFLDEIGDLSPAIQVKLLRVLQEKSFEPLGGTASVSADVRVITATNRDLAGLIREGRFREDLYYRIKVLHIHLPPLRERRSDVPLLCDHFIELFNDRYKKAIAAVSDEVSAALLAYEFPGNIRELENILEHAFIFCKGETIEMDHLPPELGGEEKEGEGLATLAGVKNFQELEKLYIESVLAETGGNKTLAAKRLGIHKATLFRKLKQLGIGKT
jgi:PAS domain S-box-containing protein